MEFIYLDNVNPIKENLTNLQKFEDLVLKSSEDIVGEINYKSLSDALEQSIDSGKIKSKDKVERYRVEWKNIHQNYHQGYLWYLYSAYMTDAGIEIAPWYFYNVILHQIAQVIKDNPEEFQGIFTNSNEKISIKMLTPDLDIELYTSIIRKLIPDANTYDAFFPSWSETPQFYMESIQGLFADMVQKYYSAMVLGCSCPKVRVKGNQEDWDKLVITIENLSEIFNVYKTNSLNKYLFQIINYLKSIQTTWTNPDTWKNFFFVTNCGSGHQEGVGGEFRNLLNYKIDCEMLVHQLPNTISRFPFEYLPVPSQSNSYFISGIIGSNLDDSGFLVPSYDYAITWIDKTACEINPQKLKNYTEMLAQIDRWDRIKPVGKYIKHHFICDLSHYKNDKKLISEYLNSNDIKVLDKITGDYQDSNIITQYIESIYKTQLNDWNFYTQIFGVSLPMPEFQKILEDFEKRRKNGTIEDKIKSDELDRLQKLENPDLNYSNLWFEGLNMLVSNNDWFDCILTWEQYAKQVDKVNEYCSDLLDSDYFFNFFKSTNDLAKSYGVEWCPETIIFGTLNPHIISEYCDFFPSEGKKLVKYIFFKIFDLPSKFNFEIVNLTSYNNEMFFCSYEFDVRLKTHLFNIFIDRFLETLEKITNELLEETNAKIVLYQTKLTQNTEPDYRLEHYSKSLEKFNKMNLGFNNILQFIKIKKNEKNITNNLIINNLVI